MISGQGQLYRDKPYFQQGEKAQLPTAGALKNNLTVD